MSRSGRTLAREVALQALYQHDVASSTKTPIPHAAELGPFLEQCSDDAKVVRYAQDLVNGVLSIQDDLDCRISRVAANWKLNRIATVDRCILRLALFELLEVPDVPPKVALNEAIELAKRFSTSQSGSFVNGVLDRAYREMVNEFGDESSPEENDQPETP